MLSCVKIYFIINVSQHWIVKEFCFGFIYVYLFYLGEDPMMSDQQQYRYMTVDDMKSLGDDSRLDVTHDEKTDFRKSLGKYTYIFF